MSMLTYILWLVTFVIGVIAAYCVPEETLSINEKFFFIGAWGVVLGFVLYNICKKKIQKAEIDLNEAINSINVKTTDECDNAPRSEDNFDLPMPNLPTGAIPASKLKQELNNKIYVKFPLAAWKSYARNLLKNRPITEVIDALNSLLPQMFPNASGILYMYAGSQAELHKVLSFGKNVISDDIIRPAECASFDAGDIVVSDYSSPNLTGGCTHLHHRPKGISFCAPVEGIGEHFGIFSLQTDSLNDNETIDDLHAKVSFIATTLGLFIANCNLDLRFEQNCIRDTLTGLYNRRYMEESLAREISFAVRHNTPIGIIMMYPDAIEQINETRGKHAVEQLLWELGLRFPSFVRNEDIPCRYEGNVFCIILPGANLKITRERAEKILNDISLLQIAYGDGILATTLSIGVSVMPTHASDANALLTAAGVSMQAALDAGANRIVIAEQKKN